MTRWKKGTYWSAPAPLPSAFQLPHAHGRPSRPASLLGHGRCCCHCHCRWPRGVRGGRETSGSSQHGSCEKRRGGGSGPGAASRSEETGRRRQVGVFQRRCSGDSHEVPSAAAGAQVVGRVRGGQRTKSFCHEMQRMPPLSGARVGVGAARNKSRRRTALRSPRPGDAGGRLARLGADVVFLTQHCVFVQRHRGEPLPWDEFWIGEVA